MKGIIIVPKDQSKSIELAEVCRDITEYAQFVMKQTGHSGKELFDSTKAHYSKMGWAPWELLTWKENEVDSD